MSKKKFISICNFFRSVSQDLSDAIVTMVQSCSLMLSKGTLNRIPQPVMRHRNIEPFNQSLPGGPQVS